MKEEAERPGKRDMGYEGQDFSDIAGGVSPQFIDALYARFKESPDSVDTGWRNFFEGLEGSMNAPSWANKRWPLTTTTLPVVGVAAGAVVVVWAQAAWAYRKVTCATAAAIAVFWNFVTLSPPMRYVFI